MDQWIIASFMRQRVVLERWIIGSCPFFGTEVCLKGWIDGSMDHSLIHETEIGLGAMDHWIVSFFLEQRYV